MATSVKTRCAALKRGLHLIKDGIPPNKAWQQTAKEFGVNRSSLYRWFNLVQGQPRKDWSSLLESRWNQRQPNPLAEAAWEFFLRVYQFTNPPSIRKAYDQMLTEATRQGWIVPSEISMRRRMEREGIKRRTRYDGE